MNRYMHRTIRSIILTVLTCSVLNTGCKNAETPMEVEIHTGIPVTVSPASVGAMTSYIYFSATSSFLFKASVKSPATGYVDAIPVNQGDAVKKNQILFSIRTKESAAIINDSLNNLDFKGIVNVKSAAAGLVSSIEHPKGDYVTEGDQLCEVAVTESFAFILDVPFEEVQFIKLRSVCDVVLPDGRSYKGIIKSSFPSMSVNSQTQRFIVRLTSPVNLPENLTAKIKIVKESVKAAVSLPKSSILTDETMEHFWVMKLISDSMAVKVPVITGIKEYDHVQIIRPEFNSSDSFLTTGNYGVSDTVYVNVIKSSGNEQ
jgi:biotin carboxyl carrier protein